MGTLKELEFELGKYAGHSEVACALSSIGEKLTPHEVGLHTGRFEAYLENFHSCNPESLKRAPVWEAGCEACERQLNNYAKREHLTMALLFVGRSTVARMKFEHMSRMGAEAAKRRAEREKTGQLPSELQGNPAPPSGK